MDKPVGLSSTAVGTFVKRKCGHKKIGHLGTLDPFATGVLILAVGEATKLIPLIEKRRKTYIVVVRWGVETDTLDSDGQVTQNIPHKVTKQKILTIIPQFLGAQSQIPPLYSAVHIDGVRSYDRMRQGQSNFEIPARSVVIHDIEVLDVEQDTATLKIVCETGTYIRSLVRDMAHAMGTVAHAVALRRVADGVIDESLLAETNDLSLQTMLHPMDTLLTDFPRVTLSEPQESDFRQGKPLTFDTPPLSQEGPILAYGASGLLGYGFYDREGTFKPKRGMF